MTEGTLLHEPAHPLLAPGKSPRKANGSRDLVAFRLPYPLDMRKSRLCSHPPLSLGALWDWDRGIDVHDLMMKVSQRFSKPARLEKKAG